MRVPRRPAVAGIAVLAVVGVGWAGYAASADDAAYRTARVTSGDVESTLALAGTVEPAGRADLAFATSGTVAKVTVKPGETVKAGQVLGTLDDDSLRAAVKQARATLASAKAQLESDKSAQTEAVSEAAGGPTQGGQTPSAPQSPSGPQSPPGGDDGGDGGDGGDDGGGLDPDALAELAAQQQAVIDAQSRVSAAMTTATDALAAEQAACAADVTSTACADAITAVQAAQQQVSTEQQALQDALETLGATLSAAFSSAQSANAAAATSGDESAIVLVAERTDTGPSGATVTAATLAQDQAQIDQAEADLATAEQQLETATVRAPFGGQVVAVDVEVGDSVAAGTDVFVLVSQGTTTVQVDASSSQVQQLEVGQEATATPAGADEALAGTVSQVSSVPDDESTYAVTITLSKKDLDIATGLTASVSVVTGTAEDVLTVPASAVADGIVTVLEDGKATPTPVTTGVTGGSTVEITDGVAAGDVVVLADLNEPVPTGDTEPRGFSFGGPGGGGPPVVRQFGGPGGPPS